MDWVRITRGEVEPVGIAKPGSDYVNFRIELSDWPPAGWDRAFTNPSGVEMSGGRTAPRLSGRTIFLVAPPSELASRMKEVDARIDHANDFYESRVLPEQRREEAQRTEQRRADEALMEEGRRQAQKL